MAVWGMALAVLSGTGACRREAGTDGRFEYSAGWWSAELTRVLPEKQAAAGIAGERAEQTGGAGNGQSPVRVEVPKKLGGKRVRSVAPKAFQACTNAISVKIPPQVSRIGTEAFAGCTELVWAELPSHLERLEDGLFSDCRRMEESDIPERVTAIGARAYSGCVRLRRVAVPDGVRSVGEQAFAGCASLGSLELPPGLAELGPHAFKGCTSLASVMLPDGLGSIGTGIFADCRSLERVELPPGLANIPDGAFEGCSGLRSVRIPAGVTNIGARAFAGCAKLEEIELPATVRSVQPRAFSGCPALGAVGVAEGNPACFSRDGVLFGGGGAELLHFPAARSGSYSVPEGVKRIAPDAFRGSGVEGVRVPGSVESIGESAFRDCRSLQWVALADGVRELGDAAFTGCRSLWELVLPGSVERAGKDLVSGCDGLLMLVVPDNLAPEPPLDGTIPASCTVCSRSEREAARQGKWLEDAHDPFYGLYTGEELDIVSFEGTVLAASAVPDPAKNDYDDCLCAVLVELDSLLSEAPAGGNTERVVLVNVPIMKDRRIVERNAFKPGDKIASTCAAYDDMPQAVREIQLSDDIQAFEYQQYYPLEINSVSEFQETGNKDFAKREIAVLPVRSLPRDANAAAARRERIQSEIARIEGELARHGGSFEAWREEYKSIAEKYARLCGESHAAWTNDAYFAARGREAAYQTREYIEGLLPYKKYLEENNIDLIVLRVPSKWDFAARVLGAEDFQENPEWAEHYYECLKKDIEIVDPMPQMWKERFNFPLFYFYNVPKENHPFEGEALVSAKVVSEVLGRYPYAKSEDEIRLEDAGFRTDDPRFFWPPGNARFDPAENLSFKQVVRGNGPIGNLSDSSGSPFVFLSNSLFWYPQRPLGASVPGYAAYFLQAIPDWSYQDGSHNAMIRNLVARPALLDSRRAVVMVGAPSDWKGVPPMPKYIRDGARRLTLEKEFDIFSDELAMVHDESCTAVMEKDGALLYAIDETRPTRDMKHFEIGFAVPHVAGKHTCMVRVNFARPRAVGLDLVQVDGGEVVDTCNLSAGMGQSADLFLPLSGEDANVKVFFFPQGQPKACFIKNIELWYY